MPRSVSGSRNSSSPERRCSSTDVPRPGRSASPTVKEPVPRDAQRQAWSPPARRLVTSTLSATMKDE